MYTAPKAKQIQDGDWTARGVDQQQAAGQQSTSTSTEVLILHRFDLSGEERSGKADSFGAVGTIL